MSSSSSSDSYFDLTECYRYRKILLFSDDELPEKDFIRLGFVYSKSFYDHDRATYDLQERARDLGADAIISFQLDEITVVGERKASACGTAVRFVDSSRS